VNRQGIAVMGRGITLAPRGLAIVCIEIEADRLLIVARLLAATAACPLCGAVSARASTAATGAR
jgi:hypothetical protein